MLPLPETTHYPLAEGATAIRVMGAAGHTGKLVLDVPHTGQSTAVVPPENAEVFRGDGAYVVTGGMGGLGLFLAEKMAAAGCGRIVLNGRSAPSAEATAAIDRIRATGTEVEVSLGDIADPRPPNARSPRRPRPDCRCVACCTPRPSSRTRHCPTSPTS